MTTRAGGRAELDAWSSPASDGPATRSNVRRLLLDSIIREHEQMSDDSQSRSAKAQKAEEVQAAGSAKAGAGHPVVHEGGHADAPTEGKGHPKPAAWTADTDGAPEAGTTSATAGRAEKESAAGARQAKEQHGRGRRKSEEA